MSVQLNCHLQDDKVTPCHVVFAEKMSIGNLSVCVEIDSINIYFHSIGKIRQVMKVLMLAEEKMSELEAGKP